VTPSFPRRGESRNQTHRIPPYAGVTGLDAQAGINHDPGQPDNTPLKGALSPKPGLA